MPNGAMPLSVEGDLEFAPKAHEAYEDLPERGIRAETCRKFGYAVTSNGEHIAKLVDGTGREVARKIRGRSKSFRVEGNIGKSVLFGQNLWGGGGPRLVITEGEIDCLSVAQVFGNRWPVVSVTTGAAGAGQQLNRQVEFLEEFDRVILMFDEDEAGHAAVQKICEDLPLTPGKLHIAHLPRKDANECLVNHEDKAIVSAVFQARPYVPGGIVNLADTWELVSEPPEYGVTYPWPGLSEFLHGQRPKEIVTWVAGTGVGKSAFVREVAYHLGIRLGKTVGYIALEESLRTTSLGFISRHLGRRLHLPNIYAETPKEDLEAAFNETLGKGNIYADTHFGSTDSLLPKLRYLIAANKCEFLFIDHISIMVSGMAIEGNEREKLDTFTTDLRKLSEQTGVGVHLVSHLRRVHGKTYEEGSQISLGDIRGTGAIGQLSDIVIGLERNQQGNDDKNVTTVRVLKNRFSGETGEVSKIRYFSESGILKEDLQGEF